MWEIPKSRAPRAKSCDIKISPKYLVSSKAIIIISITIHHDDHDEGCVLAVGEQLTASSSFFLCLALHLPNLTFNFSKWNNNLSTKMQHEKHCQSAKLTWHHNSPAFHLPLTLNFSKCLTKLSDYDYADWWWWWGSDGHSFLLARWLQIEVGPKSLSLVRPEPLSHTH